MKEKLLEYLLKESAVGIRLMKQNNTTLHVFDIGKFPDGKEYSFMMLIVPTEMVNQIPFLNKKEKDAPCGSSTESTL